MKTKLLGIMLLAGSTLFAETRFSVSIGMGGYGNGYYAAPAPSVAYAPRCPGPGYSWIDGYWGPGRSWRRGYWSPPVYSRGYLVERRGERDRFEDRHNEVNRDRGRFENSYDGNRSGGNRFNNSFDQSRGRR